MQYLYEELEKTTNTGCWKLEIPSNSLFWSPQTYKIHGVDSSIKIDLEQAIQFYHPDDQLKIEEAVNNLVLKGEEFRLYLRIINDEGKIKFVESFGKPLIENGETVAIYGTFKDISQEVSIVQSRKIIKESYSSYKKHLDDHFIVTETDENGVITYVNENFIKLAKYEREDVLGKTHRILNSGHHEEGFFKDLWDTISSGKVWVDQICNKDKEGNLYWVQTYIFPKYDMKGKTKGYTSLRYDITDKKETEKELQVQAENTALAAQLAAVGEISAGIAHEIANPLSIISGYSTALRKNHNCGNDELKALNAIDRAADRIQKIIKGLHHLSQKSRNEGFEKIPLKNILENTLEFCEEALKSKHIKLNFEIPNEDLFLFCNDTKISQVVLNLINNAKDSILECTSIKEKWINIEVVESMEDIKIHVIDSGPGIPEHLKSEITKTFFTTKPVGKGTGLGLSLVNRFIQEHNGQFYLNESYSNTCFTISLPKVKNQKAA